MGLIYLDTRLLIYAVEEHPIHSPKMAAVSRGVPLSAFAISPLVKLECLVRPSKHADSVLRGQYEQLFDRLTTVGMPESVYFDAATLRGRFGLRTPDALHLACAHHHRCSELWTHDDRLLRAGRGVARKVLD